MTRRSRLSTRRLPSLGASPSTSSLHSDTTQLFHNNRFSPDPSQLASDFSAALLHLSVDDPLCDVVLRTADDVEIPANKSVLAVRSPYFRKLFFSRFAEAFADRVTLPLRAIPLRHALHYIYTADAPLVHEAVRRLPPRAHATRPVPRPPQRALLHDLVDLAVAADYVHLTALQRLANDALTALVAAFPSTTCTALEAIRSHPTALKFCDLYRVWADIMRHPRHFFLVPDCLAVPALHPENPLLPHFGVLELSAETLEHCVTRVAPPIDYEYLFQVVYFWATEGEILQRHPPSDMALDTVKVMKRRSGASGVRVLGKASHPRSVKPAAHTGASSSVLSTLSTSSISSAQPTPVAAPDEDSPEPAASAGGAAPGGGPAPTGTTLLASPPPALAPSSSLSQPEGAVSGVAASPSPSMSSTSTLLSLTTSALAATSISVPTSATSATSSVAAKQAQAQAQSQPIEAAPEAGRDTARWRRGSEVALRIDLKQLRPLFLRDYVEWTGLVTPQRLVAAYRFHATRGASPLAPRTREAMRTAAKRSREQAASGN